MIRILPFLLFLTFTISAQRPAPAPEQTEAILIIGATAHIGNGSVIENSVIAFEDGKITLAADAATVRIDISSYPQVFNAGGMHVYPGFIAPDTRLGLVEIEAVRATRDFAEVGSINPNARAIIAYNTDSQVIPTVRSNGVLIAQITPSSGRVSGTSTVVQLDAWNWEDAAIHLEDGVHLNWPTHRSPQWSAAATANPNIPNKDPFDEQVRELETYFSEAQAYSKTANPEKTNLRFESMRGLFSGSQRLYIHAQEARAIRESVLFAERYGCQPVIVGGMHADRVADFLKEHKVPVILHKSHALPVNEDAAVDQPFTAAASLHKEGVLFCISGEYGSGMGGSWDQRNLPFQAGHAVGYGLPYEQAVAAVTLNSAKILGIAEAYGSLEAGKSATLFISEGDALDMRGNKVTAAFINGRKIDLNNKQKELYKLYEGKYRQ